MSEKTEKPTPRRLREARKRGQFPQSRVLTAALIWVAAGSVLPAVVSGARANLVAYTQAVFLQDISSPGQAIEIGSRLLGAELFGVLALIGGCAAVITFSVAGFRLNLGAVRFRWDRLGFSQGLRRLFSRRAFFELGFGLIASTAVGCVLASQAVPMVRAASIAMSLDPLLAMPRLAQWLLGALGKAGGALVVAGMIDYGLAAHRNIRELRMTRSELKQELKEDEGDGQLRQKRRSLHRQLALGGGAGLQRAKAVVVNPTHIAIGLYHDPDSIDAPTIVARGRDQDAFRIKRAAKKLGIPIVQDIPLARALVQYEIGDEVPEELYQATAAVLAVALNLERA